MNDAASGETAQAAASRRIVLAHEAALRLGPLTIEPALRRITRDTGEEEIVEPRVMQVLTALARKDGVILSRDDLIESCWAGRIVGEDAINRVVSRLRRIAEGIGRGAFRIETIARVGYRLVREADPGSGPGPAPETSGRVAGRTSIGRRTLILGTLGIAAGTSIAFLPWPRPKPRTPPRLAVLAFDRLGDTPAYFAEGLAEELINEASRIRGLQVIGRASSFALRTRGNEPRLAAQILGATLVLHGSVREAAGRIRVTANLWESQPGALGWSEAFERPASEVYQLQRDIALRVAQVADLQVTTPPPQRVDPGAFQSYLRGRRSELRSADGINAEAEALYGLAVQHDSRFAEAWAGLGRMRFRNAYWSWIAMPQGSQIDRARLDSAVDAVTQAIRRKRELAGPLEMRASIRSCIGEWRGCDRDTAAAIERGGAPIWALIRMGSTRDAAEVARRNAALNPLDTTALDHLGEALRLVGAHAEALPAVERSFSLSPSADSAHDLVLTLIATGAHDRARQVMDAHSGLLDAGLTLHAPQTRQFLLATMNAAPPPGISGIVERVARGDGYFEQAALMFAQLGVPASAGAMIDRMGMADLPNVWVLFDQRCRSLQRLPSFLSLMRRVGLLDFWRSGVRPPQFCARAELPFPCRA